MAENAWLGPSERALAFGEQYAAVLAHWGLLFTAASQLVEANVALGRTAVDSANEFETWMRTTAAAPWNLMGPDALQRFMSNFGKGAAPSGD